MLHIHFGCYGNLEFTLTYNGKLALIAVLLQEIWQNIFRIVC